MQNDLVHLHQLQLSETGALEPLRKRRVTFSENDDVKVKAPQGTKLEGEDITRLPEALTKVVQDDDQHLEADIPMSTVAGDAAGDMEQQTAIQRCGTHTIVHECVTRSRDAKELTREDTTSVVVLATEFAEIFTSKPDEHRALVHGDCFQSKMHAIFG